MTGNSYVGSTCTIKIISLYPDLLSISSGDTTSGLIFHISNEIVPNSFTFDNKLKVEDNGCTL